MTSLQFVYYSQRLSFFSLSRRVYLAAELQIDSPREKKLNLMRSGDSLRSSLVKIILFIYIQLSSALVAIETVLPASCRFAAAQNGDLALVAGATRALRLRNARLFSYFYYLTATVENCK